MEAALTAARTAIAAEATSAAAEVVPIHSAARRRRLPRLLVSAAAVAVLATGVAVYPVVGGEHGPAATATAAGFPREVAAAAGERPVPGRTSPGTTSAPFRRTRRSSGPA